MAPTYYDDNFGHYDIEDQDDVDFYFQVQAESVLKTCQGCDGEAYVGGGAMPLVLLVLA